MPARRRDIQTFRRAQFRMKFSTSLALAAAASSASAHTIFVSLNGGAVGDGVRVPTYDGVCLLTPYFIASFIAL